MFYVSLIVITRQKPTVDKQKRKRKESKYITMKSNKSQRKRAKEGRNKGIAKRPENNEQNGS